MSDQRLRQLFVEQGQSPWIDNLKRSLITSGGLQSLIDDGVRGLTSNPTIFQKAIQDSVDYDQQYFELRRHGLSTIDIYQEMLSTRRAAFAERLPAVLGSRRAQEYAKLAAARDHFAGWA